MKINATMSNDKMKVEYLGKTLEFVAWKTSCGFQSDYVFASPVVRNGKEWPVSVLIDNDGIAKVFYPSGLTLNRGSVRITGFWEDSTNKSKHNKV